MFFEAEVRIKSNTEEFKSNRRRKEGACDVYGVWGRRSFYADGCADEHNFGFLRIQLKKVNEMPIIDCIRSLPQISELIRHAMAGEDREETCVICILMEGYFEVMNYVGQR